MRIRPMHARQREVGGGAAVAAAALLFACAGSPAADQGILRASGKSEVTGSFRARGTETRHVTWDVSECYEDSCDWRMVGYTQRSKDADQVAVFFYERDSNGDRARLEDAFADRVPGRHSTPGSDESPADHLAAVGGFVTKGLSQAIGAHPSNYDDRVATLVRVSSQLSRIVREGGETPWYMDTMYPNEVRDEFRNALDAATHECEHWRNLLTAISAESLIALAKVIIPAETTPAEAWPDPPYVETALAHLREVYGDQYAKSVANMISLCGGGEADADGEGGS